MKLGRWFALLSVAVLSAGVATAAVQHLNFFTLAERTVADIRVAMISPPEPQDPDIVIVAITEETLRLFPYRSPVDRLFLANLLRMLEKRQPRAIAVDVLFDQPTEPDKDALIKETIETLSVPLFVSYTDQKNIVDERQLKFLDAFLPDRVKVHAALSTDPVDGVVREIFPGSKRPDGTYMMGFARAIAAHFGVTTPDTPQEAVWHGSPDAETPPFRMYPAHLVQHLPPAWFKNKIVLIGASLSLTDRYRTPFATVRGAEGELPGVVIHAHALSQLLNHRRSLGLSPPAEWLFVAFFALLGTAFGCLNRGLIRHMLMSGLTLGALWPAAFYLFHAKGVMLPLVEPSFAFLLATWGADAFTGREARRQKEFINSAFSRYLNPQLVKQLSSDPKRLSLGGETREMTLMFCDIRGFTTISEMFDAQGLTRLINRFLTPMTDVILERQGTIDKYMGDCIMAFWNAPLEDPGHARHACRSALAMIERLDPLNAELQADAKAQDRSHIPIRIGIGLNSGPVVVGNMGSNQRFDYSVLGDNVNLASRLEGQSKTYGVTIVLGENTYRQASNFACLELDLIKVKGKTEAARIYALLGDEALAGTTDFKELAAEHGLLLDAYRAQEWPAALDRIARCRALGDAFHLHELYDLYEERIAAYRTSPPPPAWDGVHVALTK